MAPQSTSTATLCQDQFAAVNEKDLDCNHNEVPDRVRHPAGAGTASKRQQSVSDLNERTRKLIRNCFSHLHTNLNVLVIGAKGAGELLHVKKLFWQFQASNCII